jgi:hypothetical protein
LKASSALRTISTFSSDIAHAVSRQSRDTPAVFLADAVGQ